MDLDAPDDDSDAPDSSWLHRLHSAQVLERIKALENISFGLFVVTTEEGTIEYNALERDIPRAAIDWDQISTDCARIENNVAKALRARGFILQDNGHSGDNARAYNAYLGTGAQALENLKTLLHIEDTEPPNTGAGTLSKLYPNADMLVFTGVSEQGQSVLDVQVDINIPEEFKAFGEEYSLLESVLIENETDDVDPNEYVKNKSTGVLTGALNRLGFKVGNDVPEVHVIVAGEEVENFWYKKYTVANETVRALALLFSDTGKHLVLAQWDAGTEHWLIPRGAIPKIGIISTSGCAAAIRDLDAAMVRSAAASLPLEQERAALERVARHYIGQQQELKKK